MAETGIAGFIDYDSSGRPFMGLVVEDGALQVHVYLAHKDRAQVVAQTLARALTKLANDLRTVENKIILVEGTANDGTFRK